MLLPAGTGIWSTFVPEGPPAVPAAGVAAATLRLPGSGTLLWFLFGGVQELPSGDHFTDQVRWRVGRGPWFPNDGRLTCRLHDCVHSSAI